MAATINTTQTLRDNPEPSCTYFGANQYNSIVCMQVLPYLTRSLQILMVRNTADVPRLCKMSDQHEQRCVMKVDSGISSWPTIGALGNDSFLVLSDAEKVNGTNSTCNTITLFLSVSTAIITILLGIAVYWFWYHCKLSFVKCHKLIWLLCISMNIIIPIHV